MIYDDSGVVKVHCISLGSQLLSGTPTTFTTHTCDSPHMNFSPQVRRLELLESEGPQEHRALMKLEDK